MKQISIKRLLRGVLLRLIIGRKSVHHAAVSLRPGALIHHSAAPGIEVGKEGDADLRPQKRTLHGLIKVGGEQDRGPEGGEQDQGRKDDEKGVGIGKIEPSDQVIQEEEKGQDQKDQIVRQAMDDLPPGSGAVGQQPIGLDVKKEGVEEEDQQDEAEAQAAFQAQAADDEKPAGFHLDPVVPDLLHYFALELI